jgi:hypothetical protein
MDVVRYTAESPDVTDDDERGTRIQERLDALGIADREFHARTGIDRKTLRRAVANDPGVRHSTYMAINAALDKMEAAVRGIPVQRQDPGADYVEFTVEGNFGVRAVVKGPVKDMDELQRAVAKLIRDMKGEEGPDSGAS